MKDDTYEREPRRTAGACAPIVQWIVIVLTATFGIGSWSISTVLCVDRLNAEGGRDSASWLMCSDSCCFSKMPQVRTMHDKPDCVQT